jgi:hypothetical protein
VQILEIDQKLYDEWKASRKLCLSPKTNIGASAEASCKSQGLRAREGKKTHLVGKTRIAMGGRKIKGKKYGGEIPDYGSGTVA